MTRPEAIRRAVDYVGQLVDDVVQFFQNIRAGLMPGPYLYFPSLYCRAWRVIPRSLAACDIAAGLPWPRQ